MAPIASTVALMHNEEISDSARARELYKYYQPVSEVNKEARFPDTSSQEKPISLQDEVRPSDADVTSSAAASPRSSPDTALTAFCQLVTWRTGAQRAMISVIDSSTQYFLAESTKTLDLVDNTKHSPGDDLWMGCGSVSKAGRLCERTIAVKPPRDGAYPSFIVTNLAEDPSFSELPFVKGPPFLKLYAGVPLITKRGIPIGSLFIVDDRTWSEGVSVENINFMGTMAITIMKHFEMTREVEEHRRGMKMSRGLASFVEGKSQLAESEIDGEEGEGTRVVGQFDEPRSTAASVSSIERKEKEYSSALLKTEETIMADLTDKKPEDRPDATTHESFGTSLTVSSPPVDLSSPEETNDLEGSSMKMLLSRASNLIREAFEVDGGAVFFDAQRGFNGVQPKGIQSMIRRDDSSQPTSGDELHVSNESNSEHEEPVQRQAPSGLREQMFSRSSTESRKPVEILGFSTSHASSINGEDYPGPHSFVPFDEKSLNVLLSRYPKGKLWTFDSDGSMSSSSEEDKKRGKQQGSAEYAKDILRRRKKSARAKSDASFLARHFPGVRQLIFIPLWDAGRSRWLSGCCVWSTEATRVLSKTSELSFLSAFGNTVMAECSRIETEIADQKKGDFIGSISHELRSPLHGILASAEFLGEEQLSGFERGLVATIDSCGRTLLDTINHILDFSKINHFEKNWRKTKRGAGNKRPQANTTNSALALRQSDLPMINLFAEVDISTICEEVVESVFAGHVFQNITAQSFDQVPNTQGKMALSENVVSARKPPEVAVILDVDVQNYHFTTQPGAFRRIIMNLLGNALKYTSHGYVRVTLEASEIEDLQTAGSTEAVARSMITLTFSDTGKGISREYLRSKAFMPFTQEDSLSSGTGLGLSIVRSIVNLLEGEIVINSEVGVGTQVKVTLPLLRGLPGQTDSASTTSPMSVTVSPRETDETMEKLRQKVMGKRVSLWGFEINTPDVMVSKSAVVLKNSIANFVTSWYGMELVPLGIKSSIIIANEADPVALKRLQAENTVNGKVPSILVLCSHSSRFDKHQAESAGDGSVGFVSLPVGPQRLARALLQCLDGAPALSTPGPPDPTSALSDNHDLSSVFEEVSLSPRGGEVLDNSRMAADSVNARKAIESPTPGAIIEKGQEFPFPARPDMKKQPNSMPGVKSDLEASAAPSVGVPSVASVILTAMEKNRTDQEPKPSEPLASQPLPPPRLLLVDDNTINLNLLRTYISRSRNYKVVDEAQNGLDAVNKFNDQPEGYDIIFMDISMPVLDGFGATRQIRAIEEGRKKRAIDGAVSGKPEESSGRVQAELSKGKAPALVIALTGLASSRDQTEAFESGVDLFLTKPVAFKEVGKMLDNWEANRERELGNGG